MNKKKVLIVIAGPTAVGKTEMAIQLAQYFSTEIISADSRQFYKDLIIGTAAPTDDELKKAMHHFIGNLSLSDYYNVSIYEQQALQKLETIFEKSDFAIAVGGSGLYINALCHGIDELPDAEEYLREQIKTDFAKFGLEYLQKKVMELDPVYFENCDQKNPKRLMRAFEVCLATGKPYSSLRKNFKAKRNFEIIKICLISDREVLNERINLRVEKMMDSGLLEEAKKMLPYKDLNSLNTVGYKELFRYFENEISLEQAIIDIKTNSRRYAKRQVTWFKKDSEFCWLKPELSDILKCISEKLSE